MQRKTQSQAYPGLPPAIRPDDTRQAFQSFAYTVAHDLNAPLRCIVNFSQLLGEKCRGGLDDKAQHYLDLIVENGRKAQARLAALLQYSSLDTVPLQKSRVDCNDVLERCLEQLRPEIDAREAALRVRPLPSVIADGDRLGLLFFCLLSNALKFCHKRPEIEIAAQRGHNAWVFSVQDNGIGIAPHDRDTIFEIFRRLHKDEEYSGIGIGLALARRIAELHGGIIWVESRSREGAMFCFTLPDAAFTSSTPS